MGSRLVRRWLPAAAAALALAPAASVRADTVDALRRELETMKRQMQQMQHRIEKQEEQIRRLEAERAAAPAATAVPPAAALPADAAAALDRAVAEAEAAARTAPPAAAGSGAPALAAATAGGATLRLVDVSVDVLAAAGASTEREAGIRALQGGAHDPRRRGFTLQQAELSLAGAVDPYFTGEAHVVFTDSSVELEEAFLTTQRLPFGLQLEAGHFFTEFGRINPVHPHAWQWIDQPVVVSRLFGGDGLRNPGGRLGWLVPVPWFSEVHLGAQDPSGETAVSFLGEQGGGHDDGDAGGDALGAGIGGRPMVARDVRELGDLLYLTRWENAWSIGDTLSAKVGASALFGPNASGRDGRTTVYGADVVAKWRPAQNFRGWPFLLWESELMQRDYEADRFVLAPFPGLTLPGDTFHDWGLYAQLLYGFRYPWAAGLRYEFATGSGQSLGGRSADPLRDDRHRVSPLFAYRPTEFSRIRLQYNYDRADHLAAADAHSVWLGLEILYGSHAAHRY